MSIQTYVEGGTAYPMSGVSWCFPVMAKCKDMLLVLNKLQPLNPISSEDVVFFLTTNVKCTYVKMSIVECTLCVQN
jgi:hypothetical protein